MVLYFKVVSDLHTYEEQWKPTQLLNKWWYIITTTLNINFVGFFFLQGGRVYAFCQQFNRRLFRRSKLNNGRLFVDLVMFVDLDSRVFFLTASKTNHLISLLVNQFWKLTLFETKILARNLSRRASVTLLHTLIKYNYI